MKVNLKNPSTKQNSSLLRENTLFVGKFVQHLPEVPSTSQYLREWSERETLPEGTVVATHRQTAGRGQPGNGWFGGEDRNLSLSVLLRPGFLPARHQFRLNQVVALAVHDTIAALLGPSVRIKWPNDIYVQDRKVAGILIQNTLLGSNIAESVVGIGINVNQEEFPEELSRATSLFREKGDFFELKQVAQYLYHHLEARYLQLRGGRFSTLHQEYIQNFYRLDQPTHFRRTETGDLFVAAPTVISERGELVLEHPNGGREFVGLKELEWLHR